MRNHLDARGRCDNEHCTSTTSRLEAFSDGVFSIAITLLVLESNCQMGFIRQLTYGERWVNCGGAM